MHMHCYYNQTGLEWTLQCHWYTQNHELRQELTFLLDLQKPMSMEVPSITTCCAESTLKDSLLSAIRAWITRVRHVCLV